MEGNSVVVAVAEIVANKPVVVTLVAGMIWALQQRLGHKKFVAYPYNPLR